MIDTNANTGQGELTREEIEKLCSRQWNGGPILDHDAFQRARIEALEKDAKRYAWLRDGNGYAPEEDQVDGGEDLDDLCDAGILGLDRREYKKMKTEPK